MRRYARFRVIAVQAIALLSLILPHVTPVLAQDRDRPGHSPEAADGVRDRPAGRRGLPPGPGFIGDIARDPKTGELRVSAPKAEIHLCAGAPGQAGCDATSLQSALDRVYPGGTLVIHPGDYRQAAFVRRNGIRIRALPGARLVGTAVGGKGALVIAANDVVIEGLACTGIAVRSRNGACIRLEGRNLTLRRVHFSNSEEGMLGDERAGRVLIEDSRFENLGSAGQAHGIYTGGDELIIRRSLFLASKDQGHEIKSRAARTVVEDSVIASLGGNDSYLIDIANGGEALIRRNLLQEGAASVNFTAISFGMEGIRYARPRITIEENLILLEGTERIVVATKGPHAAFARNIVAGRPGTYQLGQVDAACGEAGNVCSASRSEALRLAQPNLPRIEGLSGILAETGLFR